MTIVIQKQLAGHEDLLLGSGVVAQTRGDSSQNIRRIELSWILRSTTEIRNLNVALYTRVQLHQSGANIEYWYDATSALADDGNNVLLPTSAPATGRWLKVVAGGGGGSYLPLAGGQLTGPVYWLNGNAVVQLRSVASPLTANQAYFGVYTFDGVEPVLLMMREAGEIGAFQIKRSGRFEFNDVEQTTGANRFIAFKDGTLVKMVLGTPWEDGTGTPSGKSGYDHFQLYFKRDAETVTPFQEAWNGATRQYWISGKGEALFSGGLEIAELAGAGTFSYTAFAEENGGVTDGAMVFKPVRQLVTGSPTYFTAELHIETSTTTDPGSNPNLYHRFTFGRDGQFIADGFTMRSTGTLGLFGTTPVTRLAAFGEVTGFTAGVSASHWLLDSATTGGLGTTAVTVGDVVKSLKRHGYLPL